MGFEKQRQKLKTSQPKWGDQFPARDRRPGDQSVIAEARDNPTFHSPTLTASYDARVSKLDALITRNGMHAESTIQPRNTFLSTKGWTIDSLLKKSKNFHHIKRVLSSSRSLAKSIEQYEANGKPLVIEGWHNHKNWAEFTLDGFCEASGEDISVRNIHDRSDRKISLSDFITKSRTAPQFATPEEAERLYWKDAECPPAWKEWLQDGDTIPAHLLVDGPGDVFRYRPKTEVVETLMCYVGVGDTFTPCHKDLCGSSGQNLMCYTENDGSSFWFMSESSSAPQVADYFQSLRQEIDHESHVITIDELSKAPFKVYITEQKLGDLVLVPPRSCHQVVNFGGITIKTSWSRMTWKGLSMAYYHELPIYRRVCRSETYRVKSTIYYTLLGLTRELNDLLDRKSSSTSGSMSRSTTPTTPGNPTLESHHEPLSASDPQRSVEDQLIAKLSETLSLYDAIISDEYSPLSSGTDLTAHERTTCDFCGADVFQSFFECRKCTAGQSESSDHGSYVVCAGCYVEGRSCKCLIMEPMQCRPFDDLLSVRRQTVKVLQAGGLQKVELEPNFLEDCRSGTFRAARLLLKRRKHSVTKTTKVCTIARVHEDSHTLPFASTLACRGCHSAKCFSHILVDQRMHSAEALLFHEFDETQTRGSYHQRHLNGKKRFEDGISSLQTKQKNGLCPNLQLQCVDMALKYGACRPIAPTFMSPGWYDTVVHVPRAIEHPGFPQADEHPEKFSAPTPIIQPASKSSTHNKSSSTFPPEMGRRPNLAFVLVPPASYTISGPLHFSSITNAAPQISNAAPQTSNVASAIQKEGTLDPAEASPLSDSPKRKGKRKADDEDFYPSPSTAPAKIRRKRSVTSGNANVATRHSLIMAVTDVNSTIDSPLSDCDLRSCADVQILDSQITSAPGNSKGSRKKAVPRETAPRKPLTRSATTVKKKLLRPDGDRHFPSQLADAMNSANSGNAQPLAKFQPSHSSANDSTSSPGTSSRPKRVKGKRMMMEVEPSPQPLETRTSDVAENQPTSQTASYFHPEGGESDEASKILTSTAVHGGGKISTQQQPDRLVALESPPSEAVHPPLTFQQQPGLHPVFQLSEDQGGSSANASNVRKLVGPATSVHPAPISNQPTQHDSSGLVNMLGVVLQAIGGAFVSMQLEKPEPHENSHLQYLIQSLPGPSRTVSHHPPPSGPRFNAAREQRAFTSDQQYYPRERRRGSPYGRPPYPHMGTDSIADYDHQMPLNRNRSGPNTFYHLPNWKHPKYSYPGLDSPSRRPRQPLEEYGARRELQRQRWDREPDPTSLESVTQIQPHPSIRGYPRHNPMLERYSRYDLRPIPSQYKRQPDARYIQPHHARGHHSNNRVAGGRAPRKTQPVPGFQAGNPMVQRRCVSESGAPSSASMNDLVRSISSTMSLKNQSERGDRTPNANSCGTASFEDTEIRSGIEGLREPSPHRSEVEDPQIWEDDYAKADEVQQPMNMPDGGVANIDGASTASPNGKPSSSRTQSRAQTPSDLTFNAWA